MSVAQFFRPVLCVERMHLQRGRVDQKARPDKAVVQTMIAQDVADILAEKTFDAFAEFLDAVDVLLPASSKCRLAHRADAA